MKNLQQRPRHVVSKEARQQLQELKRQREAYRKKISVLHKISNITILLIESLVGLALVATALIVGHDYFGITLPWGYPDKFDGQNYVQTITYVMAPKQSNTSFLPTEGTGTNTFSWSEKPNNLRPLEWEELSQQDQAWCNWMRQGVSYIESDGVTQKTATPSHDVCRFAITVESMGGVPASQLIALKQTESDSELNPNAMNKKSFAKGDFQFMDGTWPTYKPWPTAEVTDSFAAFLAASSMNTRLGIDITKPRTEFIRAFSCMPAYVGCAVWNFHSGQADAVYSLAWYLQAARTAPPTP